MQLFIFKLSNIRILLSVLRGYIIFGSLCHIDCMFLLSIQCECIVFKLAIKLL